MNWAASFGRFFLLALVDGAHLASTVVPAMRARAVWRFRLAAVRAIARLRGHERIVGAPLRRARFGVAAFGIGHVVSL
jgi:hypothetical protein